MAQEPAKEPAEPLESEDVVDAEKHRYGEGKPNERYYDHRDGDNKRPKQILPGLLRRRLRLFCLVQNTSGADRIGRPVNRAEQASFAATLPVFRRY